MSCSGRVYEPPPLLPLPYIPIPILTTMMDVFTCASLPDSGYSVRFHSLDRSLPRNELPKFSSAIR